MSILVKKNLFNKEVEYGDGIVEVLDTVVKDSKKKKKRKMIMDMYCI